MMLEIVRKPNQDRSLRKQTEVVLEPIALLVRKKKESRLTRIFPGKRQMKDQSNHRQKKIKSLNFQ